MQQMYQQKTKKNYAATFFHLKTKITPLCCEAIFLQKL
jgi:hypothetical protein